MRSYADGRPASPGAIRAFEDYAKLGDGRSLEKLREQYEAERRSGTPVPTTRLNTLKKWSTTFGWQQELSLRAVEEEQAYLRLRKREIREFKDRSLQQMKLVTTAAISAATKLVQEMQRQGDQERSAPPLGETVKALDTLLRLQLRLMDQPETITQSELSTPEDRPLHVQHDVTFQGILAAIPAEYRPGLLAMAGSYLPERAAGGAGDGPLALPG